MLRPIRGAGSKACFDQKIERRLELLTPRQDAMTSLQIYIKLVLICLLPLLGCQQGSKELESPYSGRQVWAVAPLMNSSGNPHVQLERFTDELRNQFSSIPGLELEPLDRTYDAMSKIGLTAVSNQGDAKKLLAAMNVDGLVVGNVTAYDPYDPPKIGMSLELYLSDHIFKPGYADPGHLTRQATGDELVVRKQHRQPVASISEYVDAGHKRWRDRLKLYALTRGQQADPDVGPTLYRINIDLYSEFVSHVMSQKLMADERLRLESEGIIKKSTDGSILP